MKRRIIPTKSLARTMVLGGLSTIIAGCATPHGEQAAPLATVLPARGAANLTSTGFYVDDAGHVLTAGHAVGGCRRIVVASNGQPQEAAVIARSQKKDLALLKVERSLGAAAVFAREVDVERPGLVFAAGYQDLPQLLAEGGALSNAVLRSGRESRAASGDIELISDASFGTSGAPVLASSGLAIGVVTHKKASGQVFAVHADPAKEFLRAQGVLVREDDRPRLTVWQDRASFAARMSVTVHCAR